jgi:hypothetical protein
VKKRSPAMNPEREVSRPRLRLFTPPSIPEERGIGNRSRGFLTCR